MPPSWFESCSCAPSSSGTFGNLILLVMLAEGVDGTGRRSLQKQSPGTTRGSRLILVVATATCRLRPTMPGDTAAVSSEPQVGHAGSGCEYFGIEESAAEVEEEEGLLLLNPLAAAGDDLERFVRALRAQGEKTDRIARRSEEKAGR